MAGVFTTKLDNLLGESFGNFEAEGEFGQLGDGLEDGYQPADSSALLSQNCMQLLKLYQEFPDNQVFKDFEILRAAKAIQRHMRLEDDLKYDMIYRAKNMTI